MTRKKRGHRKSEFTPEEAERIAALWAEGGSAAAIAKTMTAEFGTPRSRCSVLGFAGRNRERMPLRDRAQARPPRAGAGNGHPPRVFVKRDADPAPAPLLLDGKPVGIMDLNNNMCRYIINAEKPAQYCGHPAIGPMTWCDAHKAIVYRG